MSNSSLSTSPARSSISTTAIVGTNGPAIPSDDFHFPADLISFQDRKDEALLVLKADLMLALAKEVKSLDEDNWMFEGPRSRINHISKPGGFLSKRTESLRITLASKNDDRIL